MLNKNYRQEYKEKIIHYYLIVLLIQKVKKVDIQLQKIN